MAARRRLLLRLWIIATLGVVATISAGAWWWEKQLPGKLRQAAISGDNEACLRYSEQLAALRWMGQSAPNEQAQCRRRHAQTLWDNDNPAAALRLQQQLLQSGQGDADQQQRDRARLETWRSELQERALTVFRDGDLEQAIALLSPLEQSRSPGASTLSDTMRETWNRNRLDHQQLQTLVEAERWWEALDRLNQLDHPWWKTHATPLRQTVETAIEQLRQTEEHRQHGSSNPDVISGDKLESSVQQQMQLGLDPWDAFRSACEEHGGLIEEDGPESFCRRQGNNGP